MQWEGCLPRHSTAARASQADPRTTVGNQLTSTAQETSPRSLPGACLEQRKRKRAMKRAVFFFVLLAVFVPAFAQKIETETADRTHVVHLKTALNHLTVIEVAEPVVQVAAGSPSFKVEWRENKVFIQPTETDAATNLFIWTTNQRLNYELEPAGAVTEMDFAVDQKPVHVEAIKPTNAHPVAPPSTTELLLTGTPIRLLPSKQRAS